MYGNGGMLMYVCVTKTANDGSLDGKSRVATHVMLEAFLLYPQKHQKCKPAQPAKLCLNEIELYLNSRVCICKVALQLKKYY